MGVRRAEPQRFAIDPDEAVYVIGVVSRLTRIPVWTLRTLDREGIVKISREQGCTRLYSLNDLRRLVLIRRLMIEEGVNVQGVRVIMRMEVREATG